MKTPIPTPDDILYGFTVSWDGTPQDLTAWKRQFPLWATELDELALEFIRDEQRERGEDVPRMGEEEDEPANFTSCS